MKSLLLLFVSVLCLRGTLQKQVKNGRTENLTLLGDYAKFFYEDLESDVQPELMLRNHNSSGYLHGHLSTRVIPFMYILVLTVGVPSNVAILCSLLMKIRKVSSSILYSSLAFTDLFLLLSLTFKTHYHLHGNNWVFGDWACRAVTACFYGNLYCSVQTLACISVMRYLAVAHPFCFRNLPQKPVTALVCFVNWATFVAAVVPELLIQQTYWLPQEQLLTCHDVLPLDARSHGFLLPYNIVMAVLGLLLPLVLTVWSFSRIIVELNRSHLDWTKYIKASTLVLVIFLVCFTPAGLLHLLHNVKLSVDRTDGVYAWFNVAVCLCCVHACLDPFLFLLMSHSTAHFFGLKKKLLNTSDTV